MPEDPAFVVASALSRLDKLLAQVIKEQQTILQALTDHMGCLHLSRVSVTTMGDEAKRTMCRDCGETFDG